MVPAAAVDDTVGVAAAAVDATAVVDTVGGTAVDAAEVQESGDEASGLDRSLPFPARSKSTPVVADVRDGATPRSVGESIADYPKHFCTGCGKGGMSVTEDGSTDEDGAIPRHTHACMYHGKVRSLDDPDDTAASIAAGSRGPSEEDEAKDAEEEAEDDAKRRELEICYGAYRL